MAEAVDMDTSNPDPEPQMSKTSTEETGPVLTNLEDWTKEELFQFLQAFKTFGSKDVDTIQLLVASRSREEIVAALDYARTMAKQRKPYSNPAPKRIKSNGPQVPLASWAKYLTDNASFDEIQTGTAQALRLIADLEDIPPAPCTGQIDFRRIYHNLANALEGKPIENDKVTTMALDKCITEAALFSKSFARSSTVRYIIDHIDMQKKVEHVPQASDDYELAAIQDLAAQKNYNPLWIDEKHLKPSK